jgi:RNA polymerase sigma-70 factor (ECF subfamily)
VAAVGEAGRTGESVAHATHELYRQYGKQIYAYCLHQLRSREEAEDAVQTTFLNAFRGLQRGTTTRFEQAWLYKIAQNVCIARRTSSGRRLKLESLDDFEILQEVVPSGASAGDGDTLELMGLDTALDSMPENQRRAILMREWHGLSYREISAELGLSQGAVEMLIFRARRTLALALEEPEAADKRRAGKAKTGYSFASLIAATKALMATGAPLKMAAVAVSAAVVGTNAVHSVARQGVHHAHARRVTMLRTSRSAAATLGTVRRTSVVVSPSRPRTSTHAAIGAAAAPPAFSEATTGSKAVVVESISAPATADAAAPTDPPSTVTRFVAVEAPPAQVAPVAPGGGSDASSGTQSAPSEGGRLHDPGTDPTSAKGNGRHGHQSENDPAGTPTDPTVTTTTTASTAGDASASTDPGPSGSPETETMTSSGSDGSGVAGTASPPDSTNGRGSNGDGGGGNGYHHPHPGSGG